MLKSILTFVLLACYLPVSFGFGVQIRPVPKAQRQSAVCEAGGCACTLADKSDRICCCSDKQARVPHTSVLTASFCDVGYAPSTLFSQSGLKVHFPHHVTTNPANLGRTETWSHSDADPEPGHRFPIDKIPI